MKEGSSNDYKIFKGVEYVSLAKAAEYTSYSQEYLSLRARSGKIAARKLGRNWYITRAALADYIFTSSKKATFVRIEQPMPVVAVEKEKEPERVIPREPLREPSPSITPFHGHSFLAFGIAVFVLTWSLVGITGAGRHLAASIARLFDNRGDIAVIPQITQLVMTSSFTPTLAVVADVVSPTPTVVVRVPASVISNNQLSVAIGTYLQQNGLPENLALQLRGPKGDAGNPGVPGSPGISAPAGYSIGTVYPTGTSTNIGTIGGVSFFGAKELTTQTITATGTANLTSLTTTNLTVNGPITVAGQVALSTASISGDFEVSGAASASATYGSGLTECAGSNALQWSSATGTFGCVGVSGGPGGNTGGIGAIGLRVTGSTFSHITSLSFDANAFNIAIIASESTITLDYANGPASRSIAQTITGGWLFNAASNQFSNTLEIGTASVSGALLSSYTGSNSFAGSLNIAKGLTALSYQGGGLTECDNTIGKLVWHSGQFSCQTDQTGGGTGSAFTGIELTNDLGASYKHITSLSFDPNMFDISTTTSQSFVKLDWANGPTSRSIAQTISGGWLFNAASNQFSNTLEIGTASISALTLNGALTQLSAVSSSFAGSLNTTLSLTSAKSITGLTFQGSGTGSSSFGGSVDIGKGLNVSNGTFRVTTHGNVGIGTTNPGNLVEVVRSTNGLEAMRLYNANTGVNAYARMEIESSGGDVNLYALGQNWVSDGTNIADAGILVAGVNLTGGLVLRTDANAPIVFATGGNGSPYQQAANERMRILGNGNIGIGTTAPLTKFEVQGTASASNLVTVGSLQVANGGATVSYSRFGTAATSHGLSASSDLLISGNFELDGPAWFDGVTTFANASGSNNFEVSNLASISKLYLQDGSATTPALSFSQDTNTGIFRAGADILSFSAGGLERFRVASETSQFLNVAGIPIVTLASTGSVGIGTTTPTSLLHLFSSTTNAALTLDSATSGAIRPAIFWKDNGTQIGYLTLERTTSPILPTTSRNDLLLGTFTTNNLVFAINGGEKMRINNDGNVGVSATTPEQKLEVGGNILASASANATLILNSLGTGLNEGKFSILASGAAGVDSLLVRNGLGTSLVTIASTGNATFSGAGSNSFVGSLNITKGLTATSYQGGGLVTCTAAQKLTFTNGQFSCASDLTGGGGGGGSSIEISEGGTPNGNVYVSSISFAASGFNVDTSNGYLSLNLDYANGPASRSIAQTITGNWLFNAASNQFSNTLEIGTASISGAFISSYTGSNSFAGSLNITKGLTANSYQSGGLTECDNTTGKLVWHSGQFSCQTDQTGGGTGSAFTGIEITSDLGSTYAHITSLSFDPNMFDLVNTGSQSFVKLDWANGPASRSIAQSITGAWTFSAASNQFSNTLEIGTASISALTAGSATVKTPANGVGLQVQNSTGSNILSVDTTTSLTNILEVQDSNNNVLFAVSAAGRVGVGLSTPRSPFYIRDGNASGTSASASFSLLSLQTTGSLASLSATALNGGSVFNITLPASSSSDNPHGLLLAKNVNGITIASWSMGGTLSLAGKILSDGANASCTGANVGGTGCIDYAESFPTVDQSIGAGDIVMVDPLNPSSVVRASGSATVIGIVSTNPAALITGTGFLSGSATHGAAPDGTVPVALAGRVPVYVSSENGQVHSGDHLVLSHTPGVAAKAIGAGMTIGIALDAPYADAAGSSMVVTFVNVGYWAPDIAMIETASGSASFTSTSSSSSSFVGSAQDILNVIANATEVVAQKLHVMGDIISHGIKQTYFAVVDVLPNYDISTLMSLWQSRTITIDNTVTDAKADTFRTTDAQAADQSKVDLKEDGAYLGTYGVDSTRGEIQLTGTSKLVNGEAKVFFDFSFTSIISGTAPIRVFITPTTGTQGQLYVATKNQYGFEVKELNSYDTGTFDWMVVARRKGFDTDVVAPAGDATASVSATMTPVSIPTPSPSDTVSPPPSSAMSDTPSPSPIASDSPSPVISDSPMPSPDVIDAPSPTP